MTENIWQLPSRLTVGGRKYKIRTDYRVILDVLCAMNDPDIFEAGMTEDEKQYERACTMLEILFVDFDSLPERDYPEACQKACEFIDCGMKNDTGGKQKPRSMDWEQDAPLIIPAINKTAGKDIRSVKYMHWWTFFGLYMELGDSVFHTVLSIRQKKQKGKKLADWESEFYKENRKLVDLKERRKERSAEEKEALRNLFGYGKKKKKQGR